MRYCITKISVHRSSLTLAVIYGIFGIIYIPILFLANAASPVEEPVPTTAALFMPLIIFVLTYVAMTILFALYNGVAKALGGVEIVLSGTSGATGVDGP